MLDPSTGKFIIPVEYDYIGYQTDKYGNELGNGMLYLCKDNLWGAMQVSSNGDVRLPLKFKNRYEGTDVVISKKNPLEYSDKIKSFWLYEGEKVGMIDAKGEMLIPCEYSRISFLGMQENDYTLFKDSTTVGLYDVKAKRFIVPIGKYDAYYIWNDKYKEKVYIVVKNSKYGLISLDGKEIVPCKYKDITQGASTATTPRFYHVWTTDKSFGLCNNQGKLIAPVGAVDKVVEARAEILVISKNGKIGAISYNGTTLVPMKHQRFEGCGMEGRMCFSDNTAAGGTIYVYTKDGRLLASETFDRADTLGIAYFLKNYMNVVI